MNFHAVGATALKMAKVTSRHTIEGYTKSVLQEKLIINTRLEMSLWSRLLG